LVASIEHNMYKNVKLTKKYKMKKTAAANPAAPKERRAVAPSADEDHRVRTGAARSEQTRRKLLVAALAVFAEKGTDAPVIDDFIAAAAVARGTFYNYFDTTQALLSAVTAELIDEILFRVDIEVRKIDDPVERVVCGSLLYMHIAVDNPTWGGFMVRAGLRGDAMGKLVDVYLPRDLQMASDAGKARFPRPRRGVRDAKRRVGVVRRGAPQPCARRIYPRAAGNWRRARAGQSIVRDGSATGRASDRLRSFGPSPRTSDRARQAHQIPALSGWSEPPGRWSIRSLRAVLRSVLQHTSAVRRNVGAAGERLGSHEHSAEIHSGGKCGTDREGG
jgi:AcrR family transcriptional regulator